MTVAKAAPLIPHLKAKMNNGAKIRFKITEKIIPLIAFAGYPEALKTL